MVVKYRAGMQSHVKRLTDMRFGIPIPSELRQQNTEMAKRSGVVRLPLEKCPEEALRLCKASRLGRCNRFIKSVFVRPHRPTLQRNGSISQFHSDPPNLDS